MPRFLSLLSALVPAVLASEDCLAPRCAAFCERRTPCRRERRALYFGLGAVCGCLRFPRLLSPRALFSAATRGGACPHPGGGGTAVNARARPATPAGWFSPRKTLWTLMGRPPKPPEKLSRGRDAHRQRPWVQLEWAPVRRPRLTGENRLRPETRTWWRTWCSSPEAAEFWSTDWQRLLMLVPLVGAYFREPSVSAFREIRRNEAALGRRPIE
jgi:hypothetical protein